MSKHALSIVEPQNRLPHISVRSVVSGRYEVDSRSVLHYHDTLQLFFVTAGKGALQFPLRRCFVSAEDVVLINAGASHTEYSSQSKPMEYLALELEQLEVLPKTGSEQSFLHLHREDFGELLSLVHLIQAEFAQQPDGFAALCNHLASAIVLRLLREDRFTLHRSLQSEQDCRLVHNYITNHFAEKLDLDFLASLVRSNKFHLAHAFKDLYGYSINHYLRECRIQEAKRLLTETKIGVTEIGRMVGFQTPCHFNSTFRECTDTTPRAYRKSART